ncbi:aminotransferase class I/II-fold pyridoxal phosphate-dependent enzyme [Pseudomonas graminis]|uniref:aminotransferase class I/II-fold pyridoxal phosphate-dependent enzyme n=1 Tax=Pseudomonas graminis TaxID=158627 RepID=UPI0023492E16|nr:aminotransferase class I/II-fold pyridoxal phosphate-dependent enzyme [Pseudomonas graminis]MDC6382023.1 aminotransferase class I/II-fold pyridoxal phosphate-dependent enzyme [Pseudomonas graminis]
MSEIEFNDFYTLTKLSGTTFDFFSWVRDLKSAVHDRRLLDFGVADAFLPPPEKLRNALVRAVADCGYQSYVYGHVEYESACLNFVKKQCNGDVPLKVLPTSGAKSALNLVCLAFLNPGDVVLVTAPAYPVLAIMAQRLGATVVELPLHPGNDFIPDFTDLPDTVLAKVKILSVNYPNNPSGKIASQNECSRLLEFCSAHDILLVNDAAYSSLLTERSLQGSFFQNAQAKVIEVHSLSKTLQVPGWRLGFIIAAPEIIAKLRALVLLHESGQPKIFLDAVSEVVCDDGVMEQTAREVSLRRHELVNVLHRTGFQVTNVRGAFFVYVLSPIGTLCGKTFETASDFSRFLAGSLGVITIPYDVVERGFVRFSVAFKGDQGVVLKELEEKLRSVKFVFREEPIS